MYVYADSGHVFSRTAYDRCNEKRCWGWRCRQLVLADSRNSSGGVNGGGMHRVVGGITESALCTVKEETYGA